MYNSVQPTYTSSADNCFYNAFLLKIILFLDVSVGFILYDIVCRLYVVLYCMNICVLLGPVTSPLPWALLSLSSVLLLRHHPMLPGAPRGSITQCPPPRPHRPWVLPSVATTGRQPITTCTTISGLRQRRRQWRDMAGKAQWLHIHHKLHKK